jgi:hypothetical protein
MGVKSNARLADEEPLVSGQLVFLGQAKPQSGPHRVFGMNGSTGQKETAYKHWWFCSFPEKNQKRWLWKAAMNRDSSSIGRADIVRKEMARTVGLKTSLTSERCSFTKGR